MTFFYFVLCVAYICLLVFMAALVILMPFSWGWIKFCFVLGTLAPLLVLAWRVSKR